MTFYKLVFIIVAACILMLLGAEGRTHEMAKRGWTPPAGEEVALIDARATVGTFFFVLLLGGAFAAGFVAKKNLDAAPLASLRADNHMLRMHTERMTESSHISLLETRNARSIMMAVCEQEGGEYRVRARTLSLIGRLDALTLTIDPETEERVYSILRGDELPIEVI